MDKLYLGHLKQAWHIESVIEIDYCFFPEQRRGNHFIRVTFVGFLVQIFMIFDWLENCSYMRQTYQELQGEESVLLFLFSEEYSTNRHITPHYSLELFKSHFIHYIFYLPRAWLKGGDYLLDRGLKTHDPPYSRYRQGAQIVDWILPYPLTNIRTNISSIK